MNSTKYIQLLENYISPVSRNRIHQQDRAPCHESKMTREYLSTNDIITLDPWPPLSPDLNPIENLWFILKKAVRERHPKTLQDLRTFTKEEFEKLDTDYLKKLAGSMVKRLREVIRNKGKITKY